MAEIGQARLFEPPAPTHLTLADRFLVPPFSVLDARAGYWRERKRDWLNLGIRGEVGRGEHLAFSTAAEDQARYNREAALIARDGFADVVVLDSAAGRGDRLLSHATPRKGFGGDYDLSKGENAWGGAGTSIFDPVLCELVYRWFSPAGGLVLDPFAGGSVRGIVAAVLGRGYLGIDLRPEQVAANEQQRAALAAARPFEQPPEWVVGDSRDLPSLTSARYDLVFSCPPYYDLEQYSDDPRDLSNAGSYRKFKEAYLEIVWHAAEALKPDRFACFVVGEVRAKDGSYCGLVPDTIRAFEAAGCRYYNEIVLVTSVGSLPIRVSRAFGAGRKIGKTHQNALVFCKGDPRRAADACGHVAEVALEYGGATWRADGSAEVAGTGEQWRPE